MAEKLKAFEHSLDNAFNTIANLLPDESSIISLLHMIEGHDELYTTGVGKSAIVARYCADILSSVGFPTHFIDPFHAVHGDIGRIMYAAPVIVFSASGATEDLIPFLSAISYRNHLVFVTGKKDYPLKERFAEIAITIPVANEGNALGFPAASVVAQIAFCAALTAELVERNRVTKEDYRHFHPGGAIGAKLSDMQSEDV